MKYPEIKPKTLHEHAAFKKNPRVYIEAKFELLRTLHPLMDAVHTSVIQNNLTDRDFHLFLSYYAMAQLIETENFLDNQSKRSLYKPVVLKDTIL